MDITDLEAQANHIVSCCFSYYSVSTETHSSSDFISFVKTFYNLESLDSGLEIKIIEYYNLVSTQAEIQEG